MISLGLRGPVHWKDSSPERPSSGERQQEKQTQIVEITSLWYQPVIFAPFLSLCTPSTSLCRVADSSASITSVNASLSQSCSNLASHPQGLVDWSVKILRGFTAPWARDLPIKGISELMLLWSWRACSFGHERWVHIHNTMTVIILLPSKTMWFVLENYQERHPRLLSLKLEKQNWENVKSNLSFHPWV